MVTDHTDGDEIDIMAAGTMQIKNAAKWSGLSRSTLYNLMADGSLSFVRVGNRRLIPKRALQAYLRDRMESR